MPRACPVEGSRSEQEDERETPRGKRVASEIVTSLCFSCERETPRDRPVASEIVLLLVLAASVTLHGTRQVDIVFTPEE